MFATLKTIEREIRSTDGRYLLARLLPYRTAEDRIGGAVLNFVDVTSLRRAEDTVSSSEERMALVAESMTDFAILTIDTQGRIATWTAGCRHVFGYEAEEAIGQPFDILFTDEDRARGAPDRRAAPGRPGAGVRPTSAGCGARTAASSSPAA